ncbi:hypothetical protein ALQ16_200200 [Pseudomonas syringae pv. actinidiae]|nr:hypothetical protein ALQ16_200200 [Pseudomonas syringae pv. actinidiae]
MAKERSEQQLFHLDHRGALMQRVVQAILPRQHAQRSGIGHASTTRGIDQKMSGDQLEFAHECIGPVCFGIVQTGPAAAAQMPDRRVQQVIRRARQHVVQQGILQDRVAGRYG